MAGRFRDPEFPCRLAHGEAGLEERHGVLELRGGKRLPLEACDAVAIGHETGLERIGRVAEQVARLLEMDLEVCAVGGRAPFGTSAKSRSTRLV
jgi:hypothetical protein